MSGRSHDRAVNGRRGRVGLLQRPRLFSPLHRDAKVGEKQNGRQFFAQANSTAANGSARMILMVLLYLGTTLS